MKKRALVIFYQGIENKTLSYNTGWPKALLDHSTYDISELNLAELAPYHRLLWPLKIRTQSYDLIVILHSAFSNSCLIPEWLLNEIAQTKTFKVYFIGNEYKLMPEKMGFGRRIGVNLLMTQLEDPRAQALYRQALNCEVGFILTTGYDPALFPQDREGEGKRDIDIGYRVFAGPLYLGHREREEVAEKVLESDAFQGLKFDISFDPKDRFDVEGWAGFLRRCKAQVGAEAGADFFELDDNMRNRVNEYKRKFPDVSLKTIQEKFFKDYVPQASSRAISGRHVEAAAAGTLQILLEGHYSGYFAPYEHYLPIRKDYSNLHEVRSAFDDRELVRKIVSNASKLASSEFTYEALVRRFEKIVSQYC